MGMTSDEIVIKHFFLSRLSDVKRVEPRYWRIKIPQHFNVLVPNACGTYVGVMMNRLDFYTHYLKDKDKEISDILDTRITLEYDKGFLNINPKDWYSNSHESYLTMIFEEDGDEVYFNFLYRPRDGWRWKTEEAIAEIDRERQILEDKKKLAAQQHIAPVRFKGNTQP